MRVAGSYKGPGNMGLKTLNNWGYIGLTLAKGTFGLEEGYSDDEGFNVRHSAGGLGTSSRSGKRFYRRLRLYLQSRDWHGMVESRRLPGFSDLVCSQRAITQRVPMDLIGREDVEDLLLHAPPVHEARS